MKTIWTFGVIFGRKPSGQIFDGGCFIEDPEVFSEIVDLVSASGGNATGDWREKGKGSTTVRFAEGSSELKQILELCRQCDRTPELSEYWSQTPSDRLFRVRRIRKYDAKDLREAEFLTIVRWGEDLFSYAGRQGERYIAKVTGAKWKKRFGTTYCERSPYFVNDELRAHLEAEELKGILFHPVFFDRPETAKGHFWELGSSVTMPPCLLPVVTIPNTDPPSGHDYDDGGHFPKELRFRRAEVAALGDFDVAITREDIDLRPTAWWRELVISQRAYQVFRKLKLTTVAFAPVRLDE